MPGEPERALLCITPAPAIDRTAHVAHLAHGEVLRPLELVALPGGKGVNAARAAVRLGGRVITSGIAGGHAGRWIVEALAAEGLSPAWAMAAAEARTTYVTVDSRGDAVIVYERPAMATQAEWEAFLRLLEAELLPRSGRAIVAGSIPAGIDDAGYGAIVEVARRAGCPLLVDASGPGLLAALQAGPDVVKIGRIEAVECGLVARQATAAQAVAALVDHGARLAVVTDGAREVAAADATRLWLVSVPPVDVVNAVGSGDCFNAAFSLALMAGATIETALARGVAAGAANARALGAGMLDADAAHELERQVSVRREGR
ncbi:MAG TPA: PfkB family carbohydrate kinase [Anaerolineae bacterium]|nr:PfkB family carbohydrate kinase [Anaerolineae bacterium]